MPALTPLNDAPSLDKLAYEKIKDAILSFAFLPNQSLVESELAAQLAISKTPVRDALMHLEQEGLVTRVPYKGTYVSDITSRDMADIYQIRIALEGLAVQLATDLMTDDDLTLMEALIFEHTEMLNRKDIAAAWHINNRFHNVIINRCPNTHLKHMLGELDDQMKRYQILSISQGLRKEKSIPEHKMVLEALQAGASQKAKQAMCSHLQSAMNDLYHQDFEELLLQLRGSHQGLIFEESN